MNRMGSPAVPPPVPPIILKPSCVRGTSVDENQSKPSSIFGLIVPVYHLAWSRRAMKAGPCFLKRLGVFILALVAFTALTCLMMAAYHHFFGTIGGISP